MWGVDNKNNYQMCVGVYVCALVPMLASVCVCACKRVRMLI